MAQFRTKARAIELLGKNQIADLPTAITELWKNGYDAYGDNFHANLYCKEYEGLKHDCFSICDDGFGMTYDDLINKWVVLGTDSKKNVEVDSKIAEYFGKEPRITLGEKGIGRLSAAFLGNHMLMVTKNPEDKFQALFINWKIVENKNAYLEELNIPIISFDDIESLSIVYQDLIENFKLNLKASSWDGDMLIEILKSEIENDLSIYKQLPSIVHKDLMSWFGKYEHGTVFFVFDPIDELKEIKKGSIKSKKSKLNDGVNSLDYLYSALSGLFNPFDERFNIFLDTEKNIGPKLNIYKKEGTYDLLRSKEFFTVEDLESCEHWINGKFDDFGQFDGELKVDGEVIEYFWKPERSLIETPYKGFDIQLGFIEGQERTSKLSNEQYQLLEGKLDYFQGLLIYRDGFRVLPYGKTDEDFLNFEFRRTKNAGYYYFSHRKMFGYIGIGKKENPNLFDKAGREGLTNNKAFRAMKEDLIQFFITLAKEFYGSNSELKETRDKRREETKKKKDQKRRENERARKLKEEENRRKERVKNFRSELKIKRSKLDQIMNELKEVLNLDYLLSVEEINDIEQARYLADISKYENELVKLKFHIDETLPFSDRDIDKIHQYNSDLDESDNYLSSFKNYLFEKTNLMTLASIYRREYNELGNNLNFNTKELNNKVFNASEILAAEVSNKLSLKNVTHSLIPSDFQDGQVTESELKKSINDLQILKEGYNEIIDELTSRVTFFHESAVSNDLLVSTGAYKFEYEKLKNTMSELHELAQLGISIELIDHQFNVQYGTIHNTLVNLSRKYSLKSDKDFTLLKNAFNHLEGNHKLLVPMYRSMRRTKKDILGKEIVKVINDFYGTVMEKNHIELRYNVDFLDFKLLGFESILHPVFINIVNNALYWLKDSEEKIIELTFLDDNIIIRNSGKKMSYTEIEKCFDLFFSKKPSGRGMGMYLARTNLRSIGLDIYATNDSELNIYDGACFIIKKYSKEDLDV